MSTAWAIVFSAILLGDSLCECFKKDYQMHDVQGYFALFSLGMLIIATVHDWNK